MINYTQRTDNSCGPDAISFATGKAIDDVDDAWGIEDIQKFKNIFDTPWNHFAALKNLGVKWRIVDANEIMHGQLVENRCIVLLHSKTSPILVQHWAIVHKVSYDRVSVWFGDGKPPRSYTFANFKAEYTRGFPNCAYVIDPTNGQLALTWYQRAYAWITGKFV